MKPERDAYGQLISAALRGEKVYEIIERDDGLIDASAENPVYYFADYPDWHEYEKQALRCLVPGRVLDIGSGAGRVELHLQSQGREVTGIDNSPGAVEVCRARGVKDARVVSIQQVNRKLGIFSNIVMLGNNFGLFGSPRNARKLLKRFLSLTTPGARIITETLNPYLTANPIHTSYHEWNRQRGRSGGQVRIRVRFRKTIGEWFDYLFVSEDELRAIVEGTGWKILELIHGDSPWMYIAVLEKE